MHFQHTLDRLRLALHDEYIHIRLLHYSSGFRCKGIGVYGFKAWGHDFVDGDFLYVFAGIYRAPQIAIGENTQKISTFTYYGC